MKRLAIIASTSLLALCLTACGEHAKTEKETTTVTTETSQPAEAAPMHKAEATPAAANEEQAAGATTQE